MGFFTKLFNNLRTKSSVNGDGFYSLTGGSPIGLDPFNFGKGTQKEFLNEAYGGNPYVFAVIDRIASLGSSIPRKIISSTNPDLENPSPEIEALMMSPNERESGKELLYKSGASFLSTGQCFFVKTEAFGTGRIGEIIVPTNTNVVINQNALGSIINYTVSYFGSTRTVPKEDVLQILKPDITRDSLIGLSNLRAGTKVYKADNEIWANEAALHKNTGVGGILTPKGGGPPLSEPQQKALQEKWDKDNSGTDSRGKLRLQTVPMEYLKLGMNLNDLQSVQGRLDHLRAICSLYSAPSQLFGDTAASTFNNVREMKASLFTNAVIPLYSEILLQLSQWLMPGQNTLLTLMTDTIEELKVSSEDRATSIISVSTSLSKGEISFSGAMYLLTRVYGIREEEAQDILTLETV